MDCIAGIDGGGSNTRLRLVDSNGNSIAFTTSGSTNLFAVSQSAARAHLTELFSCVPAGCRVTAIGMGAAGAVAEENSRTLTEMLRELSGCSRIAIDTDAYAAMLAGLGDAPGVCITAGTGSICCGQSSDGHFARAGGWGHVFSDGGSAYWIACEAIKRAFFANDGGEPTLLLTMLLSETKTRDADTLTEALLKGYSTKQELASLAILAERAADMGDGVALRVLEAAAEQLYLLASFVCGRLFDKQSAAAQHIKIVCNGGVLLKNKAVLSAFSHRIFTDYPHADILPLQRDATWGAVFMAKQRAGIA